MKNSKQTYEECIDYIPLGCTNDCLVFESKKQTLEQECKSGNTCMAIYNIHQDEYHFLHWIFEGVDNTKPIILTRSALNELIHPADAAYVIESKMEADNQMTGIPAAELTAYKLIYECRMKDQHGIFHRVVHQYMVLQTNNEGMPCLLRLQLDIMPGNATQTPPRGITIINVRTRHMLVSHTETRLSDTEIDILKLLAKGHDSQKIADIRKNSIHTVNNHRGNIIRKTQMEDTGQSVLYAHTIGAI